MMLTHPLARPPTGTRVAAALAAGATAAIGPGLCVHRSRRHSGRRAALVVDNVGIKCTKNNMLITSFLSPRSTEHYTDFAMRFSNSELD